MCSTHICIFILFTVTYSTSKLHWEPMLTGGEGDPGLPGILRPNACLTCILGHALITCVYLFTVTYFTSKLRWEPMLAGGEGDPGLPGILRPNTHLTCIWDQGQRVQHAFVFLFYLQSPTPRVSSVGSLCSLGAREIPGCQVSFVLTHV